MTKTFVAKEADMKAAQKWVLINAEGLVLGRLASVVASRLIGKHKPIVTRNQPCGDKIVIINAEKVALTGNKRAGKVYRWHTGYPGGVKERTAGQVLEGKHAERVIKGAVNNMIAKGPLRADLMRNLYIYTGTSHPHGAQNPESLDVGVMNRKNKMGGK